MTEISPLGIVSALKAKHLALNRAGQRAIKAKAGRPGIRRRNEDCGRKRPHLAA